MTLAEALNVFVKAGIIVDPKYWENAAKNLKYLDALIIGAAKKGFK